MKYQEAFSRLVRSNELITTYKKEITKAKRRKNKNFYNDDQGGKNITEIKFYENLLQNVIENKEYYLKILNEKVEAA